MRLNNPSIAILLILFSLSRGYSVAAGGLKQNFTVATSSQSSWLKNVTKNHRHSYRPRSPGCWRTPWICRDGRYPPRPRMHCCRDQCVDLSSDIYNCGFCGIRCPFTWQCCRGFCVNTNISPFNCGACGNICPWGVRCIYGMCGYAAETWPLPHPHPHPHPRPPHFPHKPPKPQPHHPPRFPPKRKKTLRPHHPPKGRHHKP